MQEFVKSGILFPRIDVLEGKKKDERFIPSIKSVKRVVQGFVRRTNSVAKRHKNWAENRELRSRLLSFAGLPETTKDEFSLLQVEHTVAIVIGKETLPKRALTLFLDPEKILFEVIDHSAQQKIFKPIPLSEIKTAKDLTKIIGTFIWVPSPRAGKDYVCDISPKTPGEAIENYKLTHPDKSS